MTDTNDTPLIEAREISKYFGSVIALQDVSMYVNAGEVLCLLGDNGAGKSTLIKTLSGVHPPDSGTILVDGREVQFSSPRDALQAGIATVYQDLAMIPLMSISRNFFLGSEPTNGLGPLRVYDGRTADKVTRDALKGMGIDLRDTSQPVGTLSGGERQSVAIARAIHFGAKVVILDEPTSALGVKEAGVVLRFIAQARESGIGVILITHNVNHAYLVGDRFSDVHPSRAHAGQAPRADGRRGRAQGARARARGRRRSNAATAARGAADRLQLRAQLTERSRTGSCPLARRSPTSRPAPACRPRLSAASSPARRHRARRLARGCSPPPRSSTTSRRRWLER
jgi:simple sugar transport system ATP-binding protein